MIPGSSATENRFDGLVTKLNRDRQGTKHSLLKVKVWNDGHITYSGSIDAKDNEPVIVVGLKTTKMAITTLKSKPNYLIKPSKPFKKNTILIILRAWVILTVDWFIQPLLKIIWGDYDIDLKTLMTIGTPYNFTETNIKNKSEMLADFIKGKELSRQPFICIQ